MRPDAIVVGAGPGGSAAALTLARAGAQVLLVERSRFPRDKACGDGLSPRALEILSSLGVSLSTPPSIARLVLRSYRNPAVRAEFSCGAPWGASRRLDLDEHLAKVAVAAGAVLRTGTLVESLVVEDGAVRGVRARSSGGGQQILRAPVTLLAEGAVGALARQAPLSPPPGRQIAFAVRRYFEGVTWDDTPSFEMLLPLESEGAPLIGYAWIFPIDESTANVGVGFLPDRSLPARLNPMLSEFEDRIGSDPRFARARASGRPLGAPVPVGATAGASQMPGLLLIGDTAGLKNPFSAEGISKALESGVLAAEASLAWLDHGTPLREYGRRLAERHLTHERLVPGLPQLYRILRHVSRDLVPFVRGRSPISAACFAQGEFEFAARDGDVIAEAEPVAEAAARARDRARRLVYRERPFFGAIVSEVERGAAARSLSAEAVYAARSVFPDFEVGCSGLRRAAVCVELAWLAAVLFGGLDADLEEPTAQGSKGGGWIAASLALGLGDRLLARCFALSAAIPKPGAGIVAEALVRVFEQLSERALRGAQLEEDVVTHVFAAEAARAGALLGGGSRASADRLSGIATEVLSSVAPDRFLPTYLDRARGHRSRQGAPR